MFEAESAAFDRRTKKRRRCDVFKRRHCVDTHQQRVSDTLAKLMALGTSKGFRAHFSSFLLDHQVEALRLWASTNCAQSVVFRDERGAVILMALRDRSRTAASHARSLRCALRRMAVDLCLRGKWLALVSAREVLALCEANPQDRRSHPSAGSDARAGTVDADGDRVIVLG